MKDEYKRTFNFGKVAAEYNSKIKRNKITLDIELQIKNNKPVFTASGNVWNHMETNVLMGGQCIDDIYKEFRNDLTDKKLFIQIMELWEKWHLNDMNAGCEHQRADKWGEEKLNIAHLKLNYTTSRMQSDIKSRAMKALEVNGKAEISALEQELLQLEYFREIPAELVELPLYKQYYQVEKIEETTSGWTSEDKHPKGVLSKACSICGYKYGTAWVYRAIDKKDLKAIMELLGINEKEQAEISTL
jgi:hypothetical protein